MPTSTGTAGTEQAWRHVDDHAEVPIEGDVTVPLSVWRAHRDALSWRDGRAGVRLGPRDPVDAIAADLGRLALVILECGPSGLDRQRVHALREGLGYRGEIRTIPAGRATRPGAPMRVPRRARAALPGAAHAGTAAASAPRPVA
jgi:uncharacterized protein (DUF934 family)